MPKSLTQKDIDDIISVKSGIANSTYIRIRQNLIQLIISELQNNSYIKLQDIGEFRIRHEGGKDEPFLNQFGIIEKRYVEPKAFVDFIPNKQFIELLNGEKISRMSLEEIYKLKEQRQKDKNKAYEYSDYVDETKSSKVNDTIFQLAQKRKDENQRQYNYAQNGQWKNTGRGKGNRRRVRYDGITYDSVKEMSKLTGIPVATLYYDIKHNIQYIKGKLFEVLD